MNPIGLFSASRRIRVLDRCRSLFRLFNFGYVLAGISLLALAFLVYVYGAATMYFRLPSSDYLGKSFVGASAWFERESTPLPNHPTGIAPLGATVYETDKTWDGFTLYTTTEAPRAVLIDMTGSVVHQWQFPFSKAWSAPPHVRKPSPDQGVHWFCSYLYPNGDLLAVYHAFGDTPYGYGLIKVNKDSKLLWTYAANVHHAVDVGEDGRIYTLTQELVADTPPGFPKLHGPYIADYLVVLSPEGRELEKIPLLETLRDSPYALTLAALNQSHAKDAAKPVSATPMGKGDLLHVNSVQVLKGTTAPHFPLFKAGQVLISVRELDLLAMLDLPTHSVVWAAKGLWKGQHAAQFLDNGHLLLFDNLGSERGYRILEYDPVTQAIPWSYPDENAPTNHAEHRGSEQRLPNGNTLIADPDGGRLIEVTPTKELVWECFCVYATIGQDGPSRSKLSINGARRYGAGELTFLKGIPARGW